MIEIKIPPWEFVNLGVKTAEIYIGNENPDEQFFEKIAELPAEYLVAQIKSGNVKALNKLQQKGFEFIETKLKLEKNITKVILPDFYQRFEKNIEVVEATESEIEQIIAIIREGKIFATDKIALDPAFSIKIAGNRYANWTEDVLKEDAKVFLAKYKNEKVAFAINYPLQNHIYDAFLGGLLPDHENKGLGFLTLYANLYAIQKRGGKKVITGVSSNNMPIIRLHESFGFMVSEILYTLVKHK